MMGGLFQYLLLAPVEPPELTPTGFGAALLKMIAALILVCVLAYVVLWLARRHLAGRPSRGSAMRVLERCPLSARQALWIVEVAGRFFLIGAAEGSISKLAELDEEQVASVRAGEGPAPKSFWDLLRGPPKKGDGE